MENNASPKKINKVSKIIGIISTVFLVVCVGVLMYTTISYARTGLVKVFGYSYHLIQSPSMEPDIKVGDLVIVKKVPFDEIDVGDDILFKCEDTNSQVYGKYVVHRVIAKTDTEGVYRTQGINNSGPDLVPSKAEGKVVKVNSSLGGLFTFITQGRNIIFVIAIAGIVIFSVMQLCSVISNSQKLKNEKEKDKLYSDNELKEKLKKEIESELAKNQENIDKNDEKTAKNIENNEKNEQKSNIEQEKINDNQAKNEDKKDTETGSDGL